MNLLRKLDHSLFSGFLPEAEWKNYAGWHQISPIYYTQNTPGNSPEKIQAYFDHCTANWRLDKFYFHYNRPCTIEPSFGWAVTQRNQLIPHSAWYNYLNNGAKPSFLKVKTARKFIRAKKVLSLHYAWKNYWHFYNDILGQLLLADAAGLAPDTPVVIAKGLAQTRYFKEMLDVAPTLRARQWLLQAEDELVKCDEAVFCNSFWGARENFDGVTSMISHPALLEPRVNGGDRIFITRRPSRGRSILNLSEVTEILFRYGFRLVECDDLSLVEQMQIFKRAQYVVGIHGAGLTNMVYRAGQTAHILEIFPPGFLNPCYYWMCEQYGFRYYSMIGLSNGRNLDAMDDFALETAELEARLVSMLGAH